MATQATVYHPRAELSRAVSDILRTLAPEEQRCPLCGCARHECHAAECPLTRLEAALAYCAERMPEAVAPRRERVLTIARDRFMAMLGSGGWHAIFCAGLPEDAFLAGVDATQHPEDWACNFPVRLIIESASFDPVLPHERPRLAGLSGYHHASTP